MVDLSNIVQLHETVEEAILPIKDYIVHAHIAKDSDLVVANAKRAWAKL